MQNFHQDRGYIDRVGAIFAYRASEFGLSGGVVTFAVFV